MQPLQIQTVNDLLDHLQLNGLHDAYIIQDIRDIMNEQPFEAGTRNSSIFSVTAPYANPHQGDKTRILWVCSAGLLRSPTGAYVSSRRGYNSRAAGSAQEYALIPLTANLIEWAEVIVFVQEANYLEALATFRGTGYDDDIRSNSIVLDIPDIYEAFDAELIAYLQTGLNHVEYERRLPRTN